MKRIGSSFALTSSLLAFAVAGCSAANDAQPARTVPTTRGSTHRPPAPAEAPLSTATYFGQATAIDLFQLRAADIAQQRGSTRTKSLATESKRQHQAIAAQLAFAGRRLTLLPSRALPSDYREMLAVLTSAPDFDAVYLNQQRTVVARALKLHSSYARDGKSPTLRPVAQFAAQAVESELRLLRR